MSKPKKYKKTTTELALSPKMREDKEAINTIEDEKGLSPTTSWTDIACIGLAHKKAAMGIGE